MGHERQAFTTIPEPRLTRGLKNCSRPKVDWNDEKPFAADSTW